MYSKLNMIFSSIFDKNVNEFESSIRKMFDHNNQISQEDV